ncbi:MAG: hypothetical protein JSS51_10245 [Planctomycetes bacterium]|nr:hypothetical protein [Planctomycetota bacterium]
MAEEVSPSKVLKQVGGAVPEGIRPNIIIIGSVAAAYWLFRGKQSYGVRTKDIDSVISPRVEAVDKGRAIAEKLLGEGWTPRTEGDFGKPGDASTPVKQLPALRLWPPHSKDWFFELLTEPAGDDQAERVFTRFVVNGTDHYGLPSFRYTGVATFEAGETEFGIRCAIPEMMALANLLEHPEIKPDRVKGTDIKRSNKDLGRVLAIARLSVERQIEIWTERWRRALEARFPERRQELAARAGNGLRELIDSPGDLQQAADTCNAGLLAQSPVTADQLGQTARRVLVLLQQIAVKPSSR